MRARRNIEPGDRIGNCIYLEERNPVTFGTKEIRNSFTIMRRALFRCFCGKEFETYIQNVVSGNTKSCGCVGIEKIRIRGLKNKTHGLCEHPLYKLWVGMLGRCNNSKDWAYYNYGGRGIKVCDRWTSISNFIDDMYPTYIKGLDIDRKDNNGNYEPDNCRWVTRKQNQNNRRCNRRIEYNGNTKTVSEWADILGLKYGTMISRLNNWTVDKVFTTKHRERREVVE